MSGHLLGRALKARKDSRHKRGNNVPLVGFAASMIGSRLRHFGGVSGGSSNVVAVQFFADKHLCRCFGADCGSADTS
jgi:TctA family transporter